VVIFEQFGEFGDSPTPRRKRKLRNWVMLRPSDISAVEMLHRVKAKKYIFLEPSLSIR
jgi:hypothetical protein